jgi:hypothetical protein
MVTGQVILTVGMITHDALEEQTTSSSCTSKQQQFM